MKTTLPLLLAFSALAGCVTANEIPTAANATTTGSAKRVVGKDREDFYCRGPSFGVGDWYYDRPSTGKPEWCSSIGSPYGTFWYMLNAYRAGGIEGVHWRYTTNNPYVDGCLRDWNYYSKDGETLIAQISGYTTTQGDSRPWCGLRVYQPGGVEGKQWAKCDCEPW